jgi:glycosyltransferase involved in cell wall biosynthesis
MRILHVGAGFRPFRRGGLVAYVEDLMDAQVARGDEVFYFFSGRSYPLAPGPRLRRWRQRGVAMLEMLNSPLYDHGRQPKREISEPRVEALLEAVVAEVRPDVVHVQELAGLPSSIIDVARAAGVPVVVTLQDYFFLCPTFKLLDARGEVCLRREIGADCVATTALDGRHRGLMYEETIRHDLPQLPDLVPRAAAKLAPRQRESARPDAAAFQRRRDVNVERLNRADLVIAMSHRVAEIHAELGVERERLRTVHLTLAHIERLTPRAPRDGGEGPVTFASLAAFESVPKGGRLLLDALRTMQAPAGSFRLLVFGYADPMFVREVEAIPGVELRGPFKPEELDGLLDEVDVGLMTSVWEEAYGYAGVEFLAKGIPLVANAIGGVVDYVRDGETGWLNRARSPDGLAALLDRLAAEPGEVAAMAARVRERRGELVKPMPRHADEMDAIYREVSA